MHGGMLAIIALDNIRANFARAINNAHKMLIKLTPVACIINILL